MQKHYDEAKVLQLLAQGDEEAFRILYNDHAPTIYSVARQYLQSTDMAKDLVQEIFSTVWLKRTEFSQVKSFSAYLYTMSRNLALKYIKKMSIDMLTSKEFIDRLDLNDASIEKYEHLFREAVAQLPPQRKHIFELAKVEGLSYMAIADRLKISPLTVKTHMEKALRFIRHHLHQHIGSFISLVFVVLGY